MLDDPELKCENDNQPVYDRRYKTVRDTERPGKRPVFMPVGEARTMDFQGKRCWVRADKFVDVSLNNWLRHLPPEMVTSHLGISAKQIESIPRAKMEFVGTT